MVRRFIVPFLLVGVLGLLALGAAIYGFETQPTTTDLKIHNAAGETVRAQSLSGTITESTVPGAKILFTYDAPATLTARVRGPGQSNAPRTTTGPTAQQALSPVAGLERLKGFTDQGSVYLQSQPLDLVTPSAGATIKGSVRTVATVATGYVVQVQEHLAATATQAGKRSRVTRHLNYRLHRINSWTSS